MNPINIFYMAIVVSLLSIGCVNAENNSTNSYPTYQNGTLTIPRIDTPTQPGEFQNATFKYNEQGTWDLLEYETARSFTIDQVKLVITDSFPVQVFLNIQGQQTCESIGLINQRVVNNRFEVTVNLENPNVAVDCIVLSPRYYEKNIPLSVYDLTAGTYEYSVNSGEHVGTFTLAKDNRFPLTK